ncbi:NUDIX domain-containing protein [Acuticoccus sp.]|uniref:NUDIX domain-containing protein n=1 Tax=Acuticoccus sp. TaxID=1904378 RepID=UPI003B52EDEB
MPDLRSRIVYRVSGLLRPPVSLGVRLVVRDVEDRVLLVRHTYTGGWHVPGGAVDVGETASEAALRECREEAGLVVEGEPRLLGLYFNRAQLQRDHVACFVVADHPSLSSYVLAPQALEIAQVRTVPLAALPSEVTPATRRRLAEAFEGAAIATDW